MTFVFLQEQHYDIPAGTALYVQRIGTDGKELVVSLDAEGTQLRMVPPEKVGIVDPLAPQDEYL
jgi:hypothetical protein